MQCFYCVSWHILITFCPLDVGLFSPRMSVSILEKEQQVVRKGFIMISSWVKWGQDVDLENYRFPRVQINPVPDTGLSGLENLI